MALIETVGNLRVNGQVQNRLCGAKCFLHCCLHLQTAAVVIQPLTSALCIPTVLELVATCIFVVLHGIKLAISVSGGIRWYK